MTKKIIILLLISFLGKGLLAQVEKGDEAYEELSYFKAIEYYEKSLQKKKDPAVALRLAHSYRLTNNTESAEQWYEYAINSGQNNPEDRLFYAKMLLSNGKTSQARLQAEALTAINANNLNALNIIKACDIRDILLKAGDQYIVTPVAFNAPGADFCPTYWNDNIVFTSDRGESEEKSKWTGKNFTSILYTPITGGGEIELLKGEINSKYDDGAAVFSANGETMYFTTQNTNKGKTRYSKDNTNQMMIAGARQIGGTWKLEDLFPYNSTEFTSAHPALSPDGNTLIFASDRPGGMGGMDLWKCDWSGSTWAIPVNLGPTVNTSSNEIFPFLDAEGTLVFASTGWPGLGALDIFISKNDNGQFVEPLNAGAPINSSKDDFGCITKDGMNSGYFCSNINSPDGLEDIYQFKRKPVPAPVYNYKMSGVVVDKFTQIPLPGVVITLENTKTGKTETTTTSDNGRFEFALKPNSDYSVKGIKNNINTDTKIETTVGRGSNALVFTQLEHNDPRFTLRGTAINRKSGQPVEDVDIKLLNISNLAEVDAKTDAKGKFFFQLEQNSNYTITGQKENVFTGVKSASTQGLDRSTDLYVQLTLNVDIIEIGKEIALEDIYFDLNKADIRPDAAKVMDNILDFLLKNPTVEIELTSHTDARNTQEYNQALSQRRADSTMAYLIKKGIDASRLSAKGYGETKLVNRCADGVNCSEAEHQQNRRTAFKVLKM